MRRVSFSGLEKNEKKVRASVLHEKRILFRKR
jgi:hypothetical protein